MYSCDFNKRTIQSIKTQASQKIEEIKADAQNKVIMAQLDAKHKISEMQDKLTEATNEVNYQINLNKTFLRISKEQAMHLDVQMQISLVEDSFPNPL